MSRTWLLVLTVALLLTAPLSGQTPAEPGRTDLEIVVLTRPGFLVGVQAEYAGLVHAAPWVSARYGRHNAGCLLSLLGSECGGRGLSAMAGVRFKVGPWGLVEPYVTLGLGPLWDIEREGDPRNDDPEMTGTAHLGVLWVGFGRIRPRIEFGLESNTGPWMNVGLGLVL